MLILCLLLLLRAHRLLLLLSIASFLLIAAKVGPVHDVLVLILLLIVKIVETLHGVEPLAAVHGCTHVLPRHLEVAKRGTRSADVAAMQLLLFVLHETQQGAQDLEGSIDLGVDVRVARIITDDHE